MLLNTYTNCKTYTHTIHSLSARIQNIIILLIDEDEKYKSQVGKIRQTSRTVKHNNFIIIKRF